MDEFTFANLIDVEHLQTMMEQFYLATKIPVSIQDTCGTMLVATGTQEICSRFFQHNPRSIPFCQASHDDTLAHLVEGQTYEHQCASGLNEIAVPIFIDNLHLATLSLRQFYYEDQKPESATLRAQAKLFGFDADAFLESASRVPVVSRELINHIMDYYVSFVQFISIQGHMNLSLKREIQKRNETQKHSRQERDLLNRILETSLTGIVITDRTGRITYANAYAEKTLGLSKAGITQLTYNAPDWHITDFDGHSFPDEKLPFSLVKTTRKPVFDVRHAVEWNSGKRTLLSINASPWINDSGEFDGMVASIEDITERILVEQNLRVEKERAHLYLDIAPVAFLALDRNGNITLINNKGLQILGYTEAEVLGKNWFQTCLPERMRIPVHEVFATLVAGQIKPVEYYENLVLTKTGEERMIAFRNTLLHDAHGDIAGILSSGVDITEELLARQTLEESEKQFRSLYTMMAEGFALHELIYDEEHNTVDYRILDVNPAYERLAGVSYQEAVGKKASTLYGTGTPPYLDKYDKVAKTGNPDFFETYFAPMDKHFAISVSSPGPHQFATVFFDITDRVKALEALRNSEAKYRSVYETTPLAFVVWDLETKIIDWNKSAEEIFGWQREQVLGQSFFDIIVPESERPQVENMIATLLKGELHGTVINENITMSGERITCQWSNAVQYDNTGHIVGAISLGANITARVKAENELVAHREHLEDLVAQRTDELQTAIEDLALRSQELADKNKELETFTYSVSHDLKAPLRGIDGYSRLLLEDYAHLLDDDGRMFLRTIRQATGQMHQLIEDLLAYSRLERHQFANSTVDLPAIVRRVLTEVQSEIATRNIQVTTDFLVQHVYADQQGLSQALRNLIDNAIKFTRDIDEPKIEIHSRDTQSSWVISVKDNGIGFDPKYEDRIFLIFERLHRPDEYPGTGVGLAIVLKAMRGMGGSVRTESEPGHGATFYLEIPHEKEIKL